MTMPATAVEHDSTFARTLRLLRDLSPGERLEAIAYASAVHLELDAHRDMPGGLEALLVELHTRVRELQAEALSR